MTACGPIPSVKPRISSISAPGALVVAVCVLLLLASCASSRYVLIHNRTSGPLEVEVRNEGKSLSPGAVGAGERKRVDIPADFERWRVFVDGSLVAGSEIGDALLVNIAPDGAVSVTRAVS
jgi:hypothetical protein